MDQHALEQNARPIAAGLLLLLTLLLVLGSAIRDPRPHEIPVGLNAPSPMVEQLTGAFGQNAPGAFAFMSYASEADALAAIDRREVVAALIVGQAGPRLVLAGAAGDAVTGGVSAAFTNAFAAQGQQLAVESVHPFPAGDPHGIVLFFLILATLIASVVAGALAVLAVPPASAGRQLGAVTVFAVSAGVLGVATAAWLANGLGDGVWLAMGIVGFLALAIGSVTVACARLAGAPGVALGALVVVLLGIVSSGGPLGSFFLPDAYRALAPWLPVGPAYDALRGALAFAGEGVVGPVVVLAAWALASFLVAVAHGWVRPVQPRAAAAAVT